MVCPQSGDYANRDRFVESLINNRDDLDRTSTRELLALLRARPRETAGDREPTFMGKLVK
jgi:hypothetical protein